SAPPRTVRLAGVVAAPRKSVASARAGVDPSRIRAQAAAVFTCFTGFNLPSGRWSRSHQMTHLRLSRLEPGGPAAVVQSDCSRETALFQPARGGVPERARLRSGPRRAAGASSKERVAASGDSGPTVRDSGAHDSGAYLLVESAGLGAARPRAGIHRLQLHRPAARGRPPYRVRARPASCRTAARLVL